MAVFRGTFVQVRLSKFKSLHGADPWKSIVRGCCWSRGRAASFSSARGEHEGKRSDVQGRDTKGEGRRRGGLNVGAPTRSPDGREGSHTRCSQKGPHDMQVQLCGSVHSVGFCDPLRTVVKRRVGCDSVKTNDTLTSRPADPLNKGCDFRAAFCSS